PRKSPACIWPGGVPLLIEEGAQLVAPAGPDDAAMSRWLSEPLPGGAYRMLQADAAGYSVWLRKLVLQTALLAGPAFLFVDASEVRAGAGRARWLEATRAGMRDGIRQFYASQRLRVSDAEADVILRSS